MSVNIESKFIRNANAYWRDIDYEYFTSKEIVVILVHYFKYVIDNKAYRFVLLSRATELTRLVSVS